MIFLRQDSIMTQIKLQIPSVAPNDMKLKVHCNSLQSLLFQGRASLPHCYRCEPPCLPWINNSLIRVALQENRRQAGGSFKMKRYKVIIRDCILWVWEQRDVAKGLRLVLWMTGYLLTPFWGRRKCTQREMASAV